MQRLLIQNSLFILLFIVFGITKTFWILKRGYLVGNVTFEEWDFIAVVTLFAMIQLIKFELYRKSELNSFDCTVC